MAKRILEDVPCPSPDSVMEAFYGGVKVSSPTRDLPIDQIVSNPGQPRRSFDGEQLAALTDSIRELGLIQAIVVRPFGDRFQIVCGERRFRACSTLGMKTIRSFVREVDEATAYRLALAENVQRNSLTPIEEAAGYRRLLDDGMSQAQVARSLGIDRRRVSEKLVLLQMPEAAQELLSARADTFTERHARLIAQAPRSIDLVQLAQRCVDGLWSTRRLEGEIARSLRPTSPAGPRLFENIRYALNKRGGFTLTVRARSHQEVARTIAELDEKLGELRAAFVGTGSERAGREGRESTEG